MVCHTCHDRVTGGFPLRKPVRGPTGDSGVQDIRQMENIVSIQAVQDIQSLFPADYQPGLPKLLQLLQGFGDAE